MTIIIAITALVSFVFSFGNVTLLCLSVGIPRTIAWLVSPAVDLSVTGLLLATNALVQRRPASGDNTGMRLWKPRLMLCACGLLTLALNTAGPATHHRLGAALVSAVLPALLLGWSEVGPSLLHELYAIPHAAPDTSQAPDRTDDEKADSEANRGHPATRPVRPGRQGPDPRRRAPPGEPGPPHLPRQPQERSSAAPPTAPAPSSRSSAPRQTQLPERSGHCLARQAIRPSTCPLTGDRPVRSAVPAREPVALPGGCHGLRAVLPDPRWQFRGVRDKAVTSQC